MRHEPAGYRCPFCRLVAGEDLSANFSKQSDVFWRDDLVIAFISTAWWPANAGNALIVPNDHYENVYDISDDVLARVQIVGKRIAMAMRRTYPCEGTSFRQHNEPAGNQEVWHYHLHVFPRYGGDMLYERSWERRDTTPGERLPYAEKLRAALDP